MLAVRTHNEVARREAFGRAHKTSVSLEEAFWNGMKEISAERSMTLSCRKGKCAPPVQMIRLTEQREIAPCGSNE